MSTDFGYDDKTINSTGPVKPSGINQPLDPRTEVKLYTDIKTIPNPYVGMVITVLQDETNSNKMTDYKVISLKANSLGVANSVVDQVQRYVDYLGVSTGGSSIDTSNLASDLSLTGTSLQLKNSSGSLIGTSVTLPSSGTSSYKLPTASSSVLGGIKVGTNLSIDGNGVLSVILPSNSGTGYDIYNLSGKKIIAYGDSITSNGQYLRYAEKKIGVTIKNAGISSTTMTPSSNPATNGDLLTSFNGTCPDLSKYDIVTIAHGTNDLSSSVPIGEIGLITDKLLDTNTFYGAYRKVIETIIKNYPHIRIVLCTPIHKYTTHEANEVVENSVGHVLKDYVDAIHNLANMYSLIVCDMYKDCGINYLNYTTYMPDGVHPNDYGGELMGKCYINSLLKLGFDSQIVVNIPVTGVTISDKNVTVKANNSVLITATVEPSDATNKYCVWSSDNPSIATVDNGRIRGMSEGSCTITVTTNNGGFTDTCSVTVVAAEMTNQDLTSSVGFETGWITSNGTFNSSATGSRSTGYLDIEGVTIIGVEINNTVTEINAIHFYDSERNWISAQTPNDNYNKNFIYASVPSNAKYVRATANAEDGINSIKFYKMTSEGLGNNLIISDTMLNDNAVSPDDGIIGLNSGTAASDYISIDGNKYYYIESIASGALYDSSKSYTSGLQYSKINNKKMFIKSGNSDKYVRINVLSGNKTKCKLVEAIYIGYITIS